MKTLNDIKTIGVIGAGVMGSGIAQLAAQAGYQTLLYDIADASLEKGKANIQKNLQGALDRGKISEEDRNAVLDRITLTSKFEDLKGDLFIEAVLEKLEVKLDVFQKLAEQNEDDCVLATNTSTIPITRIAREIPNPERIIGMHFFNPAHIMKLVEVINGAETHPELSNTITSLAEQMGKKAAIAADSPGFIVNRVARHFYVESLKVLEDAVSDHETIDKLMENIGFRMGPFRLMDLIGVETNFSVTQSMYESFHYDPKFRPSRIQQMKAEAGHNGRKSGRGFYRYDQ